MKNTQIVFDGLVAQNYDNLLGHFIFEPFAVNILENIEFNLLQDVLEIACGTGRVTTHLREVLPAEAKLIATDLNADMIAFAKQRVPLDAITWDTADMLSLKYDDKSFDLIVCQFGVMFAPNKDKAFAEMYRVLKEGGRLIFNTWANIVNNKPFLLTNIVVNYFFDKEPVTIFKEGPFCMDDEQAVLQLLKDSGFKNNTVKAVTVPCSVESAEDAALGFITGLPTLNIIQERIPHLLPVIIETLQKEFINKLGNHPLQTSLSAWKFEAVK